MVDIEIHGFDSLSWAINKLRERMSDLRPLFEQMSTQFYKYEKTQFSNTSGSGYREDLSEDYKLQKKEKYGFIYPILFASGRLATSLLDRASHDSINIIGRQSFVIGTSVPYAIYHHSEMPRKKLPRRPLWDERDDSPLFFQWGRLINTYFKKIQKGAFK